MVAQEVHSEVVKLCHFRHNLYAISTDLLADEEASSTEVYDSWMPHAEASTPTGRDYLK